jgi:DNA polymerase-3 subunit delta'
VADTLIPGAPAPTVWDGVVGQAGAVARLQRAAADPTHAYLFVAPRGCTADVAARAFAGLLIGGSDDPSGRDADLALRGEHPDVHEVRREGASISADQAREIVRLASRTPVESDRKVLILHDFHLLLPTGAARLLKTIEEPPPSTIFVIIAEFVPNDLITIASRCARVDFRTIAADDVIARLVSEGVPAEAAADAAAAAGGDISRARLLASDPELAERRAAFAAVPRGVDGTGAAAMRLTDELLAHVERAAAPLAARHATEAADLEQRIKQYGERGSGKKTLADRHKRELRRHRTDELLAGLTVIAGVYRDALAAGQVTHADRAVEAVQRIHSDMEAFAINANETLLLQALLWSLPPLEA